MSLAQNIYVSRRFQRSIRIDSDVNSIEALEGFICPQSSSLVLRNMATQVHESNQGSFIWTGPYGSGKSSLVVALTAVLSKNKHLKVGENIDEKTFNYLNQTLVRNKKEWSYFPVVGTKDDPLKIISQQLEKANFGIKNTEGWKEADLVEALVEISSNQKKSGLIVFIDEMGKFLESVVSGKGDIYLFQQLAEAANRSKGRLIIVGILHQAFEEYGGRLSRDIKDEWTKIQGRFSDLPVNAAGEEQIELIAQAISHKTTPIVTKIKAKQFSDFIIKNRPGVSNNLSQTFNKCWPLHPIVSSLLGPISRRRFGQNQRSIFGFLNSSEPLGFQDFLKDADESDLYEGHNLYDYLKLNLEPSILSSPDGHRWSLSVDTIERCSSLEEVRPIHLELLKTIAIIDLFKERSGLLPVKSLFPYFLSKYTKNDIFSALDFLEKKSLIIFRKFNNAFALYAGSDFDIEQSIDEISSEFQKIDFNILKNIAKLSPILAKRHYHETGNQRWFEFDIVPFTKLSLSISKKNLSHDSVGKFLLAMATENETIDDAKDFFSENKNLLENNSIVLGFSDATEIIGLARETIILDHIRLNNPALSSDSVARREVESRLDNNRIKLENSLGKAFDSANWFFEENEYQPLSKSELNKKASILASKIFPKSPVIQNELVNRVKPSSSASGVKRALIHRMANNEGEKSLGIEGFPPEYSLFKSILENTNIYKEQGDRFYFSIPGENDPCGINDLYQGAMSFFKENRDRNVDLEELYDFWRLPPYGIKDGLMPIMAVAILKSIQSNLVCYREGMFQTNIDELFVDYLMHSPEDIQIRWININNSSKDLIVQMISLVEELNPGFKLKSSEPLEVGKGLISLFDSLPPWTKRTHQLSSNAKNIRTIFKKANDPNKLLFDDIPSLYGLKGDELDKKNIETIILNLRKGLIELISSYQDMIEGIKIILLSELKVPNFSNPSKESIKDLRLRAQNIKNLSGNIIQEAFVARIIGFEGKDSDIEGIMSLMVNKPPNHWVDNDIDKSRLEIAVASREFKRDETFAHIGGKNDMRHSLAIVVSREGVDERSIKYNDFGKKDRKIIDEYKLKIEKELKSENFEVSKNQIATALAELSMKYLDDEEEKRDLDIESIEDREGTSV